MDCARARSSPELLSSSTSNTKQSQEDCSLEGNLHVLDFFFSFRLKRALPTFVTKSIHDMLHHLRTVKSKWSEI